MKRFTITGKKVFRDNQEKIYYVTLNDGTMITVENNPETMAILAWSQASSTERYEFLRRNLPFENARLGMENRSFSELNQVIQEKLIEYQKSKMEKKP